MQRSKVTIETDADGNGIGYVGIVNGVDNGRLLAIRYVKDSYEDGIDIVVTGTVSGIEILTLADMNATITKYPRATANNVTDGSDALYAGQGQPIKVLVPIVGEGIKIVVSSGGNTKSGSFYVWIG